MHTPSHFAIYIPTLSEKEKLMQQLETSSFPPALEFLSDLKGFVFSGTTLLDFIKEELRHELYFIKPVNGVSLTTSSEGEQKKAMLYHLLAKKPAYLIIDELFDNLDSNKQLEVIAAVTRASTATSIIQLFGRSQDLLPFINTVLILQNNELSPIDKINIRQPAFHLSNELSIPPAAGSKTPLENPLIRMIDVNVQYEEHYILQHINWQINKGEFWQLKGPNGSGKTTLLSMINGDNTKA